MPSLAAMLTGYAARDRDRPNIAAHLPGIPLVVFAIAHARREDCSAPGAR